VSAWTRFQHCDECGVDAGKACRDDDDVSMLKPCRGRLLDTDVLPRCFWCGVDVPISGRGLAAERPCCSDAICQRVRKRLFNSEYRQQAQAKKEG
jgi:hypothetical protein